MKTLVRLRRCAGLFESKILWKRGEIEEQFLRFSTIFYYFVRNTCQRLRFFSHLCRYEIGFTPMWETSISYDHVGPRNNPLKSGWKRSHHVRASPCRIGKSYPRGRNFNQGLGKSRWNSFLEGDLEGEVSLSCMDTHDGFLYSHVAAQIVKCSQISASEPRFTQKF